MMRSHAVDTITERVVSEFAQFYDTRFSWRSCPKLSQEILAAHMKRERCLLAGTCPHKSAVLVKTLVPQKSLKMWGSANAKAIVPMSQIQTSGIAHSAIPVRMIHQLSKIGPTKGTKAGETCLPRAEANREPSPDKKLIDGKIRPANRSV